MTAPSLLTTGAALAFVLGLLIVLGYAARRFTPRGRPRRGPGQIQVLSRVGLAPRQGVATIRVDGHTAVVSYGEGGVRMLMELDGDAAERGADGSADEDGGPLPAEGDEGGFAGAMGRALKKVPALRALSLGLVLAILVPAGTISAQTTPATPTVAAPTVAGPSAGGREASRSRPARPSATTGAGSKGPAGVLPDVHLSVGNGADEPLELSGPVGTVLFIGFLTLLPTLLLLMTSFTRILVVLHFLKQALGTQTAPPAHLLAAMALILTGLVMAPTLQQANERAVAPWMAGEMDTGQMLKEASVPFRAFMLRSTREKDLGRFVEMTPGEAPETVDDIPLVTVTAAFVTSELTSAFQMGFALFLPFVVIDLVVASVLMSMGMFMLPPVMVSLPFKLLLFVLVDGWSLVLGSLVQSFH